LYIPSSMDVLPANCSPLDEARVAETYLYGVRAQTSSDRCDGVGLYATLSSEHSNKLTSLIHAEVHAGSPGWSRVDSIARLVRRPDGRGIQGCVEKLAYGCSACAAQTAVVDVVLGAQALRQSSRFKRSCTWTPKAG